MANDFNSMLKNLGGGQDIDLSRIAAVMNSPEGKELINMLNKDGGQAVRKAAEAAKTGDTNSAKQIVSSLMSDKKGAALAKKISDKVRG